MCYEDFKEMVMKEFKYYLPEAYRNKIRFETLYVVNRAGDSICLYVNDIGQPFFPNIRIADMYTEYVKLGDLQIVLKAAADFLVRATNKTPQIDNDRLEHQKDNIVFQVINTEQNKEMLRDMPHRDILNLSVVYRLVVKIENCQMGSIPICNNIAKHLGMKEEELFEYAMKNTREILHPVIYSMDSIMGLFSCEIVDDSITEDIPNNAKMWIIGNEYGINGAASILYNDLLHQLAMELGSDLYILPSSINECMVLNADIYDATHLARMVYEINMSSLLLEERLSNQIYHYDAKLRKLSLVTNVSNVDIASSLCDVIN